jgi:hypothetical protein
MSYTIRRIDYYNTTVHNDPGEAFEILTGLAGQNVNLLAFAGTPVGPTRTQLALFPEEGARLVEAARRVGLALDGPQPALLVQGDDELGAIAAVQRDLSRAGIHIYASTGVADGRGGFGYILYIRPDDSERAAHLLGV